MNNANPLLNIVPPKGSPLTVQQYRDFAKEAHRSFQAFPHYFTTGEGISAMELAHLIPEVPETVLAIYIGINDAVCNKALVSPFLIRHGHNTVFAYDPDVWAGGNEVPPGTVDARSVLADFQTPNATWAKRWTYVMIADRTMTVERLWKAKGYIDTIPAKFEDFTMMTDAHTSPLCVFVDDQCFEHPVNTARGYLMQARRRGERMRYDFRIPDGLEGETEGLCPVALNQGEKLYIARTDFRPCAHCWSNLHPDAKGYAVVNENSAVPLELVVRKPPVNPAYAQRLLPALGSADMTTDWFFRGARVSRTPILSGTFKG